MAQITPSSRQSAQTLLCRIFGKTFGSLVGVDQRFPRGAVWLVRRGRSTMSVVHASDHLYPSSGNSSSGARQFVRRPASRQLVGQNCSLVIILGVNPTRLSKWCLETPHIPRFCAPSVARRQHRRPYSPRQQHGTLPTRCDSLALGRGNPVTLGSFGTHLHDVIEHSATGPDGFGRCEIIIGAGHQRIFGATRGKYVQ